MDAKRQKLANAFFRNRAQSAYWTESWNCKLDNLVRRETIDRAVGKQFVRIDNTTQDLKKNRDTGWVVLYFVDFPNMPWS